MCGFPEGGRPLFAGGSANDLEKDAEIKDQRSGSLMEPSYPERVEEKFAVGESETRMQFV